VLLMIEAAERRRDREDRHVALLGCWVMAPWSKKRLTPEKLIKPRAARPALRPMYWPDRSDPA